MSDSPAPDEPPPDEPPSLSPLSDGSAAGGSAGAPGNPPVSPSGVSARHPTLTTVNRVLADLESLTGAALWALSDAEMIGFLDGLDTTVRLAHAVRLAAVREVDGRNLAANEGAPSTSAYLRGMLKMRPRDAHHAVGLAADLDAKYLATSRQLTTALINYEQAAAIARALNRLPSETPAQAREHAETFLLEYAKDLDAADLARLGESLRLTLVDALRPSGADDAGEDEAKRRELTLSEDGDGTTRIRGRLDAEGAAALRSAIDALSKPRPTVAGQPDLRTAAQRRADALVEITTRVLTSGTLPLTGGVRPQITVSVTVETLARRPGASPAQTGWGLPLPYATLARLCCDPSIARVVLNADGVPLNVGRAERLVSPDLRRAVVARDKGCAFPSCDRPAEWSHVHHINEWHRDGGTTELDNLVLVCEFHHRLLHHSDWTVRIGADGHPEFLPPAYLDAEQKPRRNLLRRPPPDLFAGTHLAPRTRPDTGPGRKNPPTDPAMTDRPDGGPPDRPPWLGDPPDGGRPPDGGPPDGGPPVDEAPVDEAPVGEAPDGGPPDREPPGASPSGDHPPESHH
jgi:hypothetical protein